MNILLFNLGFVQILIGLLFIIEAQSTQRLILGTISFGLGSVCFGVAVVVNRLDQIRSIFDNSKQQ